MTEIGDADGGLSVEHCYLPGHGIQLHAVRAGPEQGPVVVLLHGFPEFWLGWRKQIRPLVEAGFRVIVPDQRGYNLSDKPAGVRAYHLDVLAQDVVALIRSTGRHQVILVGHDWGAAVAWWVALRAPEVLKRLIILNSPHPLVMRETLRRSWPQRRRSWYILFFQLPWLPEMVCRWGDWRALVQALRLSGRHGTFSEEDLERYRQAWGRPAALRSMISWYRALRFAWKEVVPRAGRVPVETLLIWGDRDRFLGYEMAEPSLRFCRNGHLVRIRGCGHWVQHEEADRVNELIQLFAGGGEIPSGEEP